MPDNTTTFVDELNPYNKTICSQTTGNGGAISNTVCNSNNKYTSTMYIITLVFIAVFIAVQV